MAIAVLFCVILSEEVQAQGRLFLKATKSNGNVITTGASPNEAPGVVDVGVGGNPILANYATLSSAGFDTEKALNIGSPSAGAGAIVFAPLTIAKKGDLSSARFFLAQCQGDLMDIEIVTIALDGSPKRNVAHKIILRNAAVKAFSTDLVEDCSCQVEAISFEYGSLEIYPYTISNAGKFSAGQATGWNRITNKVINP
ncbi:type VI secretion system tube protein Hcp [Dyadobacter sp. LHD-138]|uniref:type VI secretion system tube protein Hcp n=1 Tax=Dyadobacter sp. LHD-138 TaxID=3071413 RepID=UPI0027DF7A36|nr:type VI secretion system tube protein Hcp [Dyadobacter sp. LHD-138]MDQ6478237.1 type VI secretion system tube protein Hcp [Dyadobacter sp. LHD-138]